MQRLVSAFINSVRAFKVLARDEKAFQQELVLLALSLPIAWFVALSWPVFLMLVGSILFLILVEVLNTGIEATCDAISREFHLEIQLAKDCGSLAVLISVLIVMGIWGVVIASRLGFAVS